MSRRDLSRPFEAFRCRGVDVEATLLAPLFASALAAFEAGDGGAPATRVVNAEARRRSTAEVRVALVALQWASGDAAMAEENWRLCCQDGCSAGTRQNAAALALDAGSAWGPELKASFRAFLKYSNALPDYPGPPRYDPGTGEACSPRCGSE